MARFIVISKDDNEEPAIVEGNKKREVLRAAQMACKSCANLAKIIHYPSNITVWENGRWTAEAENLLADRDDVDRDLGRNGLI